jgi:hypothetical protein
MAFFKSRPKSDIEAITARIADAEAALSDAEAALTGASATAALAADPLAATVKERAAVDEANARLSVLRDGLAHAERAERLRKNEARVRAWEAQKRSLRQKIGIIERAALEYETALDNMMSAYRRAILASKDVARLLPQGGDWPHFGTALAKIPEEAVAEFNARCSVHELSGDIGLPNAHRAIGSHPSTHVPLSVRLKGLLISHYEFLCEDPEPPEHMAQDAPEAPAATKTAAEPEHAHSEPTGSLEPWLDPEFLKRQQEAGDGVLLDDIMHQQGVDEPTARKILAELKTPKPDAPSVAELLGGTL